ncbi:MAG: tetratricopeptide repeat protein [Synechococcales cyanobacterium RM1_1_8]|nr:tetratricopeptide repeat protein [Synechococcales cyanobacterium RM1_1_8]
MDVPSPWPLRSWTTHLVCSLGLGLALSGGPALLALESSAAQAQTAVPQLVRQGYSRLGSNDVSGAISLFERAVAQFPRSIEAKLGLAIVYRRNGQDQDAWNTYQAVLEQDPDNLLALKTVGLLGGFRSEWQPQGIAALDRFLALEPGDGDARAQRALLYSFQGRFAESLADYEIVLQQNPSPDVLLGSAQIYTYSGDFVRGLELFDRYQNSGNIIQGNALIAYARALRGTNNPLRAAQILEGQLGTALNEQNIQVRSELAQAYLDAGQPIEAMAVLEPLRGVAAARLPLARALNEIGQNQGLPDLVQEAAALYRAELRDNPSANASLLREAADVLSGNSADRAFSLDLYRRLAQQAPGDTILALRILVLESQLGQVDPTQLNQRLAALVSPLPTSRAEQLAFAQALVPLDPQIGLLPVYQQLLAAGVDVPFLNFRIAQLAVEQGDFASAQAALAAYQATAAGAQDLAPQLLYADIERRLGRLDDSANRYIALLNSGSNDQEIQLAALQGLAGIRLSQGRSADALALYDRLLANNPQDLKLLLSRTAIAYETEQASKSEAQAVVNRWLQQRPGQTSPELYTLVGALPAEPQWEQLYLSLAAANPTYAPVQVRLVEAIDLRNRFQARAMVDRLVRQAQGANPNRAEPFVLEGQLAEALDDLERASNAYSAALLREPNNIEALSRFGGLRFRQRDYAAAEDLYTRVLSYQPNDLGAQQTLAELSAAQGRKIDALVLFDELRRSGVNEAGSSLRMRQIQEDFLQQRGFQPAWERF